MSYTASPRIDFELKQSELPPGCTAPLRAPADGRLVANGKVILLRLVRLRAGEFVLYARWDERNALVLRNGTPHIWRAKPEPQKLARIARDFARDNLWRCASVHLISHPQLGRAVIALDRSLHPFSPHQTKYILTSGDLKNTIDFEANLARNQSEIVALTQKLEEPGSFANFAWRWLRSTPAEQDNLWQSELVRRAELKNLMRWILQSTPEVWQQTNRISLEYCSARMASQMVSQRHSTNGCLSPIPSFHQKVE